jgi:restriction endonuclease S subunit
VKESDLSSISWEQRKLGDLLQTLPFKQFLKEPEPDGKYEIIQQGNEPVIGFANGTPCGDYKDVVIFGDHTLSLYKPQHPFFVATDGVRIVKGQQDTDGYYLLSLLERYKPQSEGYKRYYSILADTNCNTTYNTSEQEKIGAFFKLLDSLITLHQSKSDSWKNKKNQLSTISWEQRKLGEISNKVTKKNQDALVDEVFTNSAEFGIISQRDFFEKDIANAENIDGYYVVEPDDFVYNPRISTTAPYGPIKRNKLERTGAMSPLYYVFRPYDIDLSYLEWYFQTTCWHAFMRSNGNSGARSDRFAITDKIFNEMPISMPQDIEEQKLIGTFLTKLESLITLHQRMKNLLVNQ